MRKHASQSTGALLLAALLAACPGRPQAPRVPPAADQTIAIDGSVRGVAGTAAARFVAIEVDKATTVHAYRGNEVAWRAELVGSGGPLAATDKLVAAISSISSGGGAASSGAASSGAASAGTASGGAGAAKTGAASSGASAATTSAVDVRGDPAASLTALDVASGAKKWTVLFDSTEWAIATSISPLGDGFIVGGSFGGTLRAGARVVSSAGGSDGFIARIAGSGDIAWLVRCGGAGADAVQGVATRGDRIAIAGTFSTGAELGGVALARYDDRSPYGDAFAAELDGNGARRWAQTFGGRADDTVAGVAIDARGNTIVAGSVHEVVHVGSMQLVTQGTSDGIVVWYGERGEQGAAVLVGGLDFDGLRAITAVGDSAIVAGFFSGSMKLGDRALTAGGGDDSFVAAFDPNGTVATAWHVGGEGREEITSLVAIPGGFVAGVAHTAKASIEGAPLAAPKDPLRGGALVVRGL